MTEKFFNLENQDFNEKIQKIEDYLDSEPGGIMTKNLDGFKHTIKFVKELRNLEDLNKFFDSTEGKQTDSANLQKSFLKTTWCASIAIWKFAKPI